MILEKQNSGPSGPAKGWVTLLSPDWFFFGINALIGGRKTERKYLVCCLFIERESWGQFSEALSFVLNYLFARQLAKQIMSFSKGPAYGLSAEVKNKVGSLECNLNWIFAASSATPDLESPTRLKGVPKWAASGCRQAGCPSLGQKARFKQFSQLFLSAIWSAQRAPGILYYRLRFCRS